MKFPLRSLYVVVDEIILYDLLNKIDDNECTKQRSMDFEKTYTSDNEMYEYESETTKRSTSTFFMLSDIEILQVYSDKIL